MRPPVACPRVHVIAYALMFRGKSLFAYDNKPAAEEALLPPRQAGYLLRKPTSSSITMNVRESAALRTFGKKRKEDGYGLRHFLRDSSRQPAQTPGAGVPGISPGVGSGRPG